MISCGLFGLPVTNWLLVFDAIDPDWDKIHDLTFHHLAQRFQVRFQNFIYKSIGSS